MGTQGIGAQDGPIAATAVGVSVTVRSNEGAVLAVLAFGNFIVGMGAFVIVGIITPIADGLGVDKADIGMVLTSYALAYAVLSPITAAITGNLPRRIVLVLSLTAFCIGTVISALSTSLVMLAASRIVVALGGSMFTPVAAGIAVAISAPERRGKALALVFSGGTIAQIVGTPFGAWVSYHFGWAWTFWVVAILAALGAAVMFLAVARDVRFQAAGIGTILAALQDRRVMSATAFTATLVTALYIVFTFFGPLIEASVGADPEVRTSFLVLNGVGAVFGNLAGGFLSDRIGARNTLIMICVAQIVIMPFFSIVPLTPLELAIVIASWSTFSWGFMAPQQARVAQLAPQAVGIVLSINAAMIYIGITIGSAIGSNILDWYGIEALGIAGGLVALLALAHLIASDRPRPSGSSPPA